MDRRVEPASTKVGKSSHTLPQQHRKVVSAASRSSSKIIDVSIQNNDKPEPLQQPHTQLDLAPPNNNTFHNLNIHTKQLEQNLDNIKTSIVRARGDLALNSLELKYYPLTRKDLMKDLHSRLQRALARMRTLAFSGVTKEDIWERQIVPEVSFRHPWSKDFIGSCRDGRLGRVKAMVERCPQLVYEYDHIGMTGLSWACMKGHTELGLFLLKKKCYVDMADLLNRTPLYFASMARNKKLVKELLRLFASTKNITGLKTYEELLNEEGNDDAREILTYIIACRVAMARAEKLKPSHKQRVWLSITKTMLDGPGRDNKPSFGNNQSQSLKKR